MAPCSLPVTAVLTQSVIQSRSPSTAAVYAVFTTTTRVTQYIIVPTVTSAVWALVWALIIATVCGVTPVFLWRTTNINACLRSCKVGSRLPDVVSFTSMMVASHCDSWKKKQELVPFAMTACLNRLSRFVVSSVDMSCTCPALACMCEAKTLRVLYARKASKI